MLYLYIFSTLHFIKHYILLKYSLTPTVLLQPFR